MSFLTCREKSRKQWSTLTLTKEKKKKETKMIFAFVGCPQRRPNPIVGWFLYFLPIPRVSRERARGKNRALFQKWRNCKVKRRISFLLPQRQRCKLGSARAALATLPQVQTNSRFSFSNEISLATLVPPFENLSSI